MICFLLQMWLPEVSRSTSAESNASQLSALRPAPPSEFSALATTRSSEWRAISLGTSARTAATPGLPTTSPRKRTFTYGLRIEKLPVAEEAANRFVLGDHQVHVHV